MSWSNRRVSVRRGRKRIVGLNIRGEAEPQVFQVSDDVFRILEKMLAANQALGPYSGCPQFEFSEVRFILQLLGAPDRPLDGRLSELVNMWISED